MPPPAEPKIYHIVHVDRLPSIIADGYLWCDAEMADRAATNRDVGTTIGMDDIKRRRLTELRLSSHTDLYVGQCVPFYFCPRSVMLFLIHCANRPELPYRGGQGSVVHFESDLRSCVAWANENQHRWAFTSSNAGAYDFEDYSSLEELDCIDWSAVQAIRWAGGQISPSVKRGKQAEFLIERSFPWSLVSRIGVLSNQVHHQVRTALQEAEHRPSLEVRPDWYY